MQFLVAEFTVCYICTGDILTDISVWAGETMYSDHRLVLALSSHYFRLVVTGVTAEGKHPVIFLKVQFPIFTARQHEIKIETSRSRKY